MKPALLVLLALAALPALPAGGATHCMGWSEDPVACEVDGARHFLSWCASDAAWCAMVLCAANRAPQRVCQIVP